MPGLYVITTRHDDENINGPTYTADHQQHVDNLEPTKMDDYSLSIAQMQLATDPGEVGSEVQATSTAGELERLRFVIRELKGTAQWYETVVGVSLNRLWEPGDIKPTFRAAPSEGWLLLNGQTVSRTVYAALFAAIGVIGGPGDGATTFQLPNVTGRSPVGTWPGGPYATTLGELFGEQTHILTVPEMPFHAHAVADPGHVHNAGKTVGILTPGSGGNILAASGPVESYNTASSGTGIELFGTGGSLAHNNLQPGFACWWVIKT